MTFSTIFGTFQSQVMQMGDCNAPSTFQRLMTAIFQDFLGRFVHVYLDNIFIYSVKTQTRACAQIHTHTQIPAYVQLPTLFQPHVPLQSSAHLRCDQVLCPATISANHPFLAETLITHRPCTTSADGDGRSPSGVLAYTPWRPEVGFIRRIIFHHLLRLACTLFSLPVPVSTSLIPVYSTLSHVIFLFQTIVHP